MKQYIDKAAVAAEIEKKLDKYNKLQSFNYSAVKDLESLLNFLDTLEVKEEPVSKDLDEAARKAGQKYFPDEYNIWARPNYEAVKVEYAFKEGAKWQEEHLIGKMEQFLYEELSNGDIECRDMKFLIEYLKLYMKEKLYERIR